MTVYAYFAFTKFKMLPSVFANLPRSEKAMVIAMIQHYLEEKKKQNKKMSSGARRR